MVEAAILRGDYADRPLEEWLLLDLHRGICADLVPDWAGKWRDIEVHVGRLEPPAPFQLPVLMRNFALDLQARWSNTTASPDDLLLELLAFAEGRFLTIHPFRDFNGRTIRLFLVELLRRLDLPSVVLAAESSTDRQTYFSALEAADESDWRPLMEIWRQRLGASEG